MTRFSKILARSIFFLKNALFNPKARRRFLELRKEEKLSQHELDSLNWKRRKNLIWWAWEQVPFYQNYWKQAHFHPSQLEQPDDWQKIPILTKALLKASFNELRARTISRNRERLSTTGGSTGEPVKVLFDKQIPLEAISWQVMEWWGVHPSNHIAFVFRSVRQGWKQFFNHMLWWPTKRVFLDASSMTDAEIQSFLLKMQKQRSVILQGYVGAICDVAQVLKKTGLTLPSIKAIWVTSAPLSGPARHLIQESFRAPVYDQYGSGEVFWIATECSKQEGLHLHYTHRHLEFINDQNQIITDEQEGRVLITDLDNYLFPIIRYENGDRGHSLTRTCSCGNNLPLIAPVKGRSTDTITSTGGVRMAGDYLTTLFDSTPDAVQAFQIIQAENGLITLHCIKGNSANARDEIEIVKQSLSLKAKSPISLSLTSEIQSDMGKTRFIIRRTKDAQ
jgi:phenylacetate-CoA ligase